MSKNENSKMRSVRLKTASDVNRLLSRLINNVLRDQVDLKKSHEAGYLLNILLRSYEQTDLVKRIERLESLILERETDHD